MSGVDWTRVRPVLHGALERPEERRAAYLDEACRGDDELRREVERLLAEEGAAGGFLEPPVESPGDADREPWSWRAEPGGELGSYTLVERIGSGGMGDVWLAERRGSDFLRRVAVKVIRRGMDTDEVLRRFSAERQLLAELDHPGIPRLIDGDATPDGRPYLVMDFVDGVPIDRWAERLELTEKLKLFGRLCEVVAHAHDLGVVHRDLKPSNVVVTDDGQPRLLDFGIAKLLATDPDGPDVTLAGRQVLTPRYASPEQVRGKPVSSATDVYALGLLLWELLVGRPAMDLDVVTQTALENAVCVETVPRPSRALTSGSTSLRRALSGDLDTICAMALRKEPERRYANARLLGDDVRMYLENRPVRARADTLGYRAAKFTRRHRGLVLGTVGTLVALVLGLVATLVQRDAAVTAKEAARRASYVANLDAAEAALREGDVVLAAASLDDAPRELRGWEWEHLRSRTDRSRTFRRFDDGRHRKIALLDDGRTLASGWSEIEVFRGSERLLRYAREDGGSFFVQSLVSEPGGTRIAWNDFWGALWTLDVARGAGSARRLLTAEPWESLEAFSLDLAWSLDGAWLAFSTRDGVVRVVDSGSGEVVHRFHEHGPGGSWGGSLVWHPDGRRLLSAGWDETVQVYDVEAGVALGGWRAHSMCVRDLDLTSDGERLVTVSLDRTMKVWDLATRELVSVLRPHATAISYVEVLPGDERVLTVGELEIHVTDLETEEVVARLLGHRTPIRGFSVAAAASVVATASAGELREWELDTNDLRRVATCEFTHAVEPSPDGGRFATASPDGVARVWNTATLALELELTASDDPLGTVAWSPDGARLASGGSAGIAHVWDVSTGELVDELVEESAQVCELRWVGESLWLLVRGDAPRELRLVERRASDGQVLRSVALETEDMGGPGSVAFTADGEPLAATLRSAAFGLGPLAASHPRTAGATDAAGEVAVLAVDRDVTVLRGTGVARWAVPDTVCAVAVHPDGSRIALAQVDRIELWDPTVPTRVASLRGHPDAVEDVSWSRDGSTLFSVSSDGTVLLWEVEVRDAR